MQGGRRKRIHRRCGCTTCTVSDLAWRLSWLSLPLWGHVPFLDLAAYASAFRAPSRYVRRADLLELIDRRTRTSSGHCLADRRSAIPQARGQNKDASARANRAHQATRCLRCAIPGRRSLGTSDSACEWNALGSHRNRVAAHRTAVPKDGSERDGLRHIERLSPLDKSDNAHCL